MATTGFWPVKGNLKDVIDYAENPDKTTDQKYLDDDLYRTLRYTQNDEKTDKKMYVSTINCPKYDPYGAMMATKKQFGKMGGNVAYHGFQSFKPGEVTPEEAHKIGTETAKKMWGDDYQIVVTTHLNTDSLHNHFVINSVSFKTGRKFENHVSDHYRLREISDTICRAYNKSVLENADFYGGEKKAYWVRKNGGMTHRDMLRRDVSEALSMTASYAAFCRYLEGLGYCFTRDRNGNHPALIAPGWQRAVRLDRLGDQYTPDAIHDRIIANQRLPELYVTYYPAKRRTPLMELEWEMKRLNRMNSIELMFELFVALLKLCTGTNFSENKSVPLSPQLREEVRKLDQYIEDMQLLCKYHIGTAEELSAFREETIQKVHALTQERNGIYNKIRRAAEPEKAELKEKAKAISQQIAPLRKELKCADRIWDRSLDTVKNLLEQERQLEAQVMNRYKELFKMKETRAEYLPISKLHPFEGHPFKVVDNEEMDQLVWSILTQGLLTPLVVRPLPNGEYEVISGHRRLHACKKAGIETVPALIYAIDRDAAAIALVDSNLHREKILPSEKAFAYKMKMDALSRQGKRTDLTLLQNATKLDTAAEIGKAQGESRDMVYRCIRLTNLIPELLEKMDEGKIAFTPAVHLSYLSPAEQGWVLDEMERNDCTPSVGQAYHLKEHSMAGTLTRDFVAGLMSQEKANQKERLKIPMERIRKYFPKHYTTAQMEDDIVKMCEARYRKRTDRDAR